MPNPNTAAFPSAIATDSTLMVASSRGLSTITLPIDSVQTSFSVLDGTKFQVPCLVQIDTEVVFVGSSSGNTLTSCVRGFAGSSASTHGQNAQVKAYVFAYHHNQMAAEIKAIENFLGINGANILVSTTTVATIHTVSFSATPVFDCTLGDVQKITLTGNVTSSTAIHTTAGQFVTFVIIQDGTGSHSLVWPTNVLGGIAVNFAGPNQHCLQTFLCLDGTNLYATGIGMII